MVRTSYILTVLNFSELHRSDVEKYTIGYGDNYEGFTTLTGAQQAWSLALTNQTWGLPEDNESDSSSGDSSGPIVTLM